MDIRKTSPWQAILFFSTAWFLLAGPAWYALPTEWVESLGQKFSPAKWMLAGTLICLPALATAWWQKKSWLFLTAMGLYAATYLFHYGSDPAHYRHVFNQIVTAVVLFGNLALLAEGRYRAGLLAALILSPLPLFALATWRVMSGEVAVIDNFDILINVQGGYSKNYTCLYAVLIGLVCLGVTKAFAHRALKLLCYALAGLYGAASVVLLSRVGILMGLLGLGLMIPWRFRRLMILLAVGLMGAVVADYWLDFSQTPLFIRWSDLWSSGPGAGANTFLWRREMWARGIDFWRDAPWWGVGTAPLYVFSNFHRDWSITAFHSAYVQALAQSGVAGLTGWLGLLGMMGMTIRKTLTRDPALGRVAAVMMLLFVLAASTENFYAFSIHLMAICAVLGLGWGGGPKEPVHADH